MTTDAQLERIRATLGEERIKDLEEDNENLRGLLAQALNEMSYWRHRALALGTEITARNAANAELGRRIAELEAGPGR